MSNTGTAAPLGGTQTDQLTYEELLGLNTTLTKRYKDLQSHHDKVRVDLEGKNQVLRDKSVVFTPPKTEEELALFKTENPDFYGVIESVAHNMSAQSMKSLQATVDAAQATTAMAEIRAAHPDFAEIFNSDPFKAWANDQGPEIQAWINEDKDSSKVIRALSYYKAMTSTQAPVAPTQYIEPSASELVRTQGSAVNTQAEGQPLRFTREQIAKMHPTEYAANHEAIAFAAANGLIQ